MRVLTDASIYLYDAVAEGVYVIIQTKIRSQHIKYIHML